MVERKKREEVVSMEWERQWGVVGGGCSESWWVVEGAVSMLRMHE